MHKQPGRPRKPGDPRRKVIDENAVRFLIGISAILLPLFEILLALPHWLESISASYAEGPSPLPRNLFVAFNFAIGTFMLAYNGEERWESRLAKLGAAAAWVVALVPGRYHHGDFLIKWLPPWTHVAATLVLFGVLFGFCVIFRRRAGRKIEERKLEGKPESGPLRRRWKAYVWFGIGMTVSTVLFVVHWYLDHPPERVDAWHLLLVGETLGLVSFGLAWLTAAKFIFAAKDERTCLFRKGVDGSLDFLPSAETDGPKQQPDPRAPALPPAPAPA